MKISKEEFDLLFSKICEKVKEGYLIHEAFSICEVKQNTMSKRMSPEQKTILKNLKKFRE